MSPEAKIAMESYQEGAEYLPQWRTVFSAEFTRIISQTDVEYRSGVYDGLQQLGLKIEKDEASHQLLRILPDSEKFPQLLFRIYEGRMKLLSGNKNRAERDWVKAIRVEPAQGLVGISLGDSEGKEESLSYFGLKREYETQTTDGMHVNLFPERTIVLDTPLSFKR